MFWSNKNASGKEKSKKKKTNPVTGAGLMVAVSLLLIWQSLIMFLTPAINRLASDVQGIRFNLDQQRMALRNGSNSLSSVPRALSVTPSTIDYESWEYQKSEINPRNPTPEQVPDDAVEACQYLVDNKVINQSWLKIDDQGLLYFIMKGDEYFEYRVALRDLNPEKVIGKKVNGVISLSLLTTDKKPVVRKAVVRVGDQVAQVTMTSAIEVQSHNSQSAEIKSLVAAVQKRIKEAGGKPVPILRQPVDSLIPENGPAGEASPGVGQNSEPEE